MNDLQHTFGADLTISPTGDLAVSAGTQAGQERVLRRLLTNPIDYIWNLSYGAGLPMMVGQPASATRISAIARAQMGIEPAVAVDPAPVSVVTVNPNGTVYLYIRYADADTGDSQTLTVPVI